MNESMTMNLFYHLPNIENLALNGKMSNFNLDSLVNLRYLKLKGTIYKDFNFDLLKNICNHLQTLEICIKNLDNEGIAKLLYGHHFPNLTDLTIYGNKMTRLEKKLFDGFPILQLLFISTCKNLGIIDPDSFSNLKNLTYLDLTNNSRVISPNSPI